MTDQQNEFGIFYVKLDAVWHGIQNRKLEALCFVWKGGGKYLFCFMSIARVEVVMICDVCQ